MSKMNKPSLQKAFDTVIKSPQIHEAVLLAENSAGDYSESFGYGQRDTDTPMIMASITKMFTTACVLNICENKKITLADKIARYFTEEQLKGLHVYKGHEYSFDLTIADLLFQTGGLPDSFEAGNAASILKEDKYTAFADFLAKTKELTPHFAPHTGNKAYYADINFDLLGEILVKVTGQSLAAIYAQMIFAPLEMTHTYLPVDENDFIPHTYFGVRKMSGIRTEV